MEPDQRNSRHLEPFEIPRTSSAFHQQCSAEQTSQAVLEHKGKSIRSPRFWRVCAQFCLACVSYAVGQAYAVRIFFLLTCCSHGLLSRRACFMVQKTVRLPRPLLDRVAKEMRPRGYTTLSGFIRIALAASVGIPLFIATSTNAQVPPPAPAPPEATSGRQQPPTGRCRRRARRSPRPRFARLASLPSTSE